MAFDPDLAQRLHAVLAAAGQAPAEKKMVLVLMVRFLPSFRQCRGSSVAPDTAHARADTAGGKAKPGLCILFAGRAGTAGHRALGTRAGLSLCHWDDRLATDRLGHGDHASQSGRPARLS